MTWLRCNNYAEGSIAHQYQLAFREDMVSKRSKERHKMLKVWWHIHLANYIGGKEKSSSGNKRFDYGKSNICGQSTRQFQTFFPQHSYRNEMFIEGFFLLSRSRIERSQRRNEKINRCGVVEIHTLMGASTQRERQPKKR